MTNSAPIYNLRLVASGAYAMAKFSMPDFNVEAVYNLTAKGAGFACDCPAGARSIKLKPCKHQRMIRFMLGAVNTERFYEPQSGTWSSPLTAFRNGDTDGLPTEEQALANGRGAGKSIASAEALKAQFLSVADGALEPLPQPSAVAPPAPQMQAQPELPHPVPAAPTLRRRI